MVKTFVNVECRHDVNGIVTPVTVAWADGRKWNISRVIHTCSSADGEFEGIRYTVVIGCALRYIYRLNNKWYVLSGCKVGDDTS